MLPQVGIGIGTTTPNRPLTIQSNSGATALSIYARSQDDYGFIQFFGYNQTTLWSEIAGRPSNLSFYQNSNEVLRLGVSSSFFPSGNVGIGTTSPTTALSVSDGASMYANSNYLVQIKRNATNGNDDTSKASILLANNSNAMQIAYGGSTDRLRFIDGGAVERLTLLNGGNVGIGTTSPSYKLVVAQSNVTEPSGIDANTSILIKNNTWSGISMISTEATGNFITFGDNAAGFAGRIQYSHATNAMQFETAGSERMRIDSSGNVGINNTNPGQKLSVVGDGSGTSDVVRITHGNGSHYW